MRIYHQQRNPLLWLLILCVGLFSAIISFGQNVKVAIWGGNGYGESWAPENLSNVTAVTAYSGSSVALQNGRLVAWGDNFYNQTNLPPSATNIVAIARSSSHSLALRSSGTTLLWGMSFFPMSPGQTNPPFSSTIAIAAGNQFSLGLRSSGEVIQYPSFISGVRYSPFSPPPNLTSARSISAGENVAVTLKSNGTLVVWGNPACTNIPAGLSDVKAIAAGDNHVLALRSNGTVVVWGENYHGQTNVPANLSNVVEIAAGSYHNLARRANGTLVSWGEGYLGEALVPPGLTNIFGVAARGVYSMALIGNGATCISEQPQGQSIFPGKTLALGCTATGTSPLLFQWQRNGIDLPGQTNSTLSLTNFSAAEAGNYRAIVNNSFSSSTSQVAQATLGNVIGWGANHLEQNFLPPGLSNLSAFDAGVGFDLAINANATATFWSAKKFELPNIISNVVGVAAGTLDALFLREDGTIRAFGKNAFGQTNVPTSATNVVRVVIGETFCLALKQNKSVVAWGVNFLGQTNVPFGLSNVVAVACGSDHALALKSDGKVVAWGGNSFGQRTIPAGLTNVVSVAATYLASIALKADGTLTAWGNSANVPAGLSNVVAISGGSFNFLALRSDGSVIGFGNFVGDPANIVPTGLSNVVEIDSGWDHHLAVTGNGLPSFPTTIPERTLRVGETFRLPALVVGAQPLSYQWQLNGETLPDQTNAFLVITNIPARFAGKYRVIVSNAFGITTNSPTLVTVTRDVLRILPTTFRYTNGVVSFQLTGLAGAGSVITSASDDFQTWVPIRTNPPTIGSLSLTNLPIGNSALFYQSIERP